MIKIDGVEGLAELDRFLSELPEQMQRRMLTGSLKAAAKPILKQAQTNVGLLFNHPPQPGRRNHYSGVLAAGLTSAKVKGMHAVDVNVQLKRTRIDRSPQYINGVWKPYGHDPFYGRYLEFGTSRMNSKPWLTPAAMSQQGQAGAAMNADLQKRVDRWCKANGVTYKEGV